MTADAFTEAAQAAAREYARTPRMNVGTVRDRLAVAHADGWEAARAHLAAQEGHRRVRKFADDWDTCTCGYDAWPCRSQEPTDAEVEAAARTLAGLDITIAGYPADEEQAIRDARWERLTIPEGRVPYLRRARAALRAARDVRGQG